MQLKNKKTLKELILAKKTNITLKLELFEMALNFKRE
jgi:hypothetical protein